MRHPSDGTGRLPRATIAVTVSVLLLLTTVAPAPGASAPSRTASLPRGRPVPAGTTSSGATITAEGLDGRLVVVAVPGGAGDRPPGALARSLRRALAAAESSATALRASGLAAPLPVEVAWPAVGMRATGVRDPCAVATVAPALRRALALAPGDVLALLLPAPACLGSGWFGRADRATRTIVLLDTGAGAGRATVWLHELGHLLGLDHAGSGSIVSLGELAGVPAATASRPAASVADRATVMGTCACGFAAHELAALGSARVGRGLALVLAPGDSLALRLADPLDDTVTRAIPRLARLALPGDAGTLLLEYDRPGVPLPPPGLGGRPAVHVRWIASTNGSGAGASRLIDLRPGATWTLGEIGITIVLERDRGDGIGRVRVIGERDGRGGLP